MFGDIGTSPITIQTAFNPNDPLPVPISTDNVYGRSDVPRHDIAEQVADGRLDAAVARPLLQGHSGSAPHHGSRKGRQKKW